MLAFRFGRHPPKTDYRTLSFRRCATTSLANAVYAVAYYANGVTVLPCGSIQRTTWAWWDECVDAAYATLLPEESKLQEDVSEVAA
jgi:hypothetical protein